MAFVQAISPTEFPLEIAYWEAEFPPKYPMSWQRCTFKDVHHSIAHHWKKRVKKEEMSIVDGTKIETTQSFIPFDDYRIFFTTVYPNVQIVRLFVYLCIVVLLGWCGSMLSFKLSTFLSIPTPEYFKLLIVTGMIFVVIVFMLITSYHLIIKLIRK